MKLSEAEVRLVYAALTSAILCEQEFHDAHVSSQWVGGRMIYKSMDPAVTKRTRKFIQRMQRFQEKLKREIDACNAK